jgi:hypothetical protein
MDLKAVSKSPSPSALKMRILLSDLLRRRLHVFYLNFAAGNARIREHGYDFGRGQKLSQKFKSFRI